MYKICIIIFSGVTTPLVTVHLYVPCFVYKILRNLIDTFIKVKYFYNRYTRDKVFYEKMMKMSDFKYLKYAHYII